MSSSAINFSIVGVGLSVPVSALALLLVVSWLRSRLRPSALRDMPGPPSVSWVWGSSVIPCYELPRLQVDWIRRYGRTFKFHGILGTPTLFAGDLAVVGRVLGNAKYERSPGIRTVFSLLLGKGVLAVEGAEHRKQRRVLNPAFGLVELRRQTEVFISKVNDMCLIWKDMCNKSGRTDGSTTIDAFAWMNKITLDIIALAGFNYDTDSLHASDDSPNEMNRAVQDMFSVEQTDVIFIAQLVFPPLRAVPTRRMREIRRSQGVFRHVGMRLIAGKRAALLRDRAVPSETGSVKLKKNDIEGSDLLSLLIKANMAMDLPDNLRLSDEDILAQVPTFMVAGHETTRHVPAVITWGLFALSCAPQVQAKLRAELRQVPADMPSMDDLNALPYLDKVVREIMRLYPAGSTIERVASEDDIIPLSTPYTDKNGKVHQEILIRKGDLVLIPTQALQFLEEIWGPDGGEFKPERWEALPDSVKQMPSFWSNLLTFASGPHACIGYRFAVVEVKALLFAIVRSFEFNLAVSPSEVSRKTAVVVRPFLSTNPAAGSTLPLTIRPVVD
ncbi:cytochrome P450 [Vararia minispora EC-137]|uniref:Cytochrome P450 n=1 Tax=Vararia minispora EC-137 TaxID=1314806 RepID=A0ACB8Q7S0_9AGAM|nr:cytochrome P450 [Vararia minispora EC-137]